MIRGLVDTDDIPGSLVRLMGNEGTREPLVQQLALIVQLLSGSGQPAGIPEAPIDGQRYARQNANWSVLDALTDWQTCTHPAGCSGPLYVRGLGDPQKGIGMLEMIGQASATTAWDASYSFILAYMPPGLVPGGDRFALVPSSHSSGMPDSISCAWFKSTGEVAIAFIYEKGQNPLIAWFDTVSIQI